MSFLSPLFLIGAAAAAVPLILHLLKREPEARVKFSAVTLLKRGPVEQTEKRHLRELVLLALRMAAFVLLALAFARPLFFDSGAAAGLTGVTIVAIDTSYSLSAPGRFERARSLAKDAIARAPAGHLVGVVTFADDAEVALAPAAGRALASSAVDRTAVSFGSTRYAAALSAAAQHLDGRQGTIVVVTDLQESGWDAIDRASVPASARIEIVDVGAAPENLAVTALATRNDRIVATVSNSGSSPRDTRVRLTVDGRSAGELPLSIGPHQAAEAAFGGGLRGAAAMVAVDDRDGIQADNARYALLDDASRTSVLIVTANAEPGRDAFYVRHALESASAPAQRYRIAHAAASELSTWPEDRLQAHAAILLVSTRGLDRRGREALAAFARKGGGVLIALGPDVDGDIVDDALGGDGALQIATAGDAKPEPRALAPVDIRHPVFQPFESNPATLGLVTFQKVARVSGSACHIVARFTTGETAIVDCPAGEGRVVVVASDLDARWNDFPLHPTFVPFLHQTVKYLASPRMKRDEYLVGEAPAGLARVPGPVLLPEGGPNTPARRIVVNVDPREGDSARISPEEFLSTVARLKDTGAAVARVEAGRQEDRQQAWRFVLAGMLIVLAFEGAIAGRTG